jgi:hypothetical protein
MSSLGKKKSVPTRNIPGGLTGSKTVAPASPLGHSMLTSMSTSTSLMNTLTKQRTGGNYAMASGNRNHLEGVMKKKTAPATPMHGTSLGNF